MKILSYCLLVSLLIMGGVVVLTGAKSKIYSSRKFKKEEKTASLPFEVSDVGSFFTKYYDRELSDNSNVIFSRSTPREKTEYVKIFDSAGIKVCAYATRSITFDTLAPLNVYLTSFDASGKFISNLKFASKNTPQKFSTGRFDRKRHITICEYKNTWKNDPIEFGYKGNSIVKTELVTTEFYDLGDDGHFNKSPFPATTKN